MANAAEKAEELAPAEAPQVPDMTEVLADCPTNWGKWGPDDEVGALNYLTADEVMRGIQHVKQGKVFASSG